MPKIPVYESRAANLSITQGTNLNVPSFGDTLSNVAQTAEKTFESIEVSNLTAQMADFNMKMSVKFNEYQRQASPDIDNENSYLSNPEGEDWDHKFQKEYNEELTKIGEGLLTIGGNKYYQEQSQRSNASFFQDTLQAKQKIAGERAVLRHGKLVQSNSVMAYNKPHELEMRANDYNLAVDQLVESGGLSPIQAETLKQKHLPEIAVSAVQGMVDGSENGVYRAKEILESNRLDAYGLTGESKHALMKNINAIIERREKESAANQTLKYTDPWKWTRKAGFSVPKVDFNDPDSIAVRAVWVKDHVAKNGIVAMPLFDDLEKNVFHQQFNKKDAKSQSDYLAKLSSSIVDPNLRRQVGQDLLMSKEDTSIGIAFETAPEDYETHSFILTGRSARRAKSVQVPAEAEIKKSIDDYIGTQLLNHAPEQRSAIKDAIYDHYIGVGVSGNETLLHTLNIEKVNQSSESVLGPVIDTGSDRPTVSFRAPSEKGKFEWVDESEFNDTLWGLTPQGLRSANHSVPINVKTNAPLNFKKAKGKVALIPTGDGLYYVFDYRDGSYWHKSKEEIFELNLKSLIRKDFSQPNPTKIEPYGIK